MTDHNLADRLPWTTPHLELLGTMADVQNAGGGADDADGLPADGITAS